MITSSAAQCRERGVLGCGGSSQRSPQGARLHEGEVELRSAASRQLAARRRFVHRVKRLFEALRSLARDSAARSSSSSPPSVGGAVLEQAALVGLALRRED